ncbi:MAG: TetR/AcrR family transcriptional regulator [Acidobacteriota bacterium]|nr:TetR/AcrR family transcriptional regulator [Acidobacteriota bacterium]
MVQSRPPRPRNRRGEGSLLREDILAAATTILERTHNEEAVTLRGIAREVGIAAPSIAPHFPDRTAIIDAVVSRELAVLLDMLRQAVATESDPVKKLLALCRTYVSYGRERPGRYGVLVGRHFLNDWQSQGRVMAETGPLMTAAIAMATEGIQACIDSGASASTDAVADTAVLWFSLHGLITVPQAITSVDWPDHEKLFLACVTRSAQLTTLGA